MGGLRRKIPVTYWTMFAATLAITGIPGFAGYFSKDEILEAASAGPHANTYLWVLGLVGALLTSFYMFRLLFLTFFGKPRYDEKKVHVHESPRNMTLPLVILAICAVAGGWFAAPHLVGGTDYFESWVHPVFASYQVQPQGTQPESTVSTAEEAGGTQASPGTELLHALTGPPVWAAVIGLLLAWWFYIRKPDAAKRAMEKMRGLHTLIYNKYYVDEIYDALIIRPGLWISTNVLWHVVDEKMIDGTVNGIAHISRETGGQVRELQSGNARSYATWVVVGAVGFTVLLIGLWMVR